MSNRFYGDLDTEKKLAEVILFSLDEDQRVELVNFMLNYTNKDKLNDIKENREKDRVNNLLRMVADLRPDSSPSVEIAKGLALQEFEQKGRCDDYLEYSEIQRIELLKFTREVYDFRIHYVDTEGTCLEYDISVERKKEYTVKVR